MNGVKKSFKIKEDSLKREKFLCKRNLENIEKQIMNRYFCTQKLKLNKLCAKSNNINKPTVG